METTTNNSVNVNPDRLDTAWRWRPGLDIFAFGMGVTSLTLQLGSPSNYAAAGLESTVRLSGVSLPTNTGAGENLVRSLLCGTFPASRLSPH